MRLKKKILDSVSNMNVAELALLYEYIKLMENMKSVSYGKRKPLSMEEIHKMTATSRSCWSDTVAEERRDRVILTRPRL